MHELGEEEMEEQDIINIQPEDHQYTIIFLHGLGDEAQSYTRFFQSDVNLDITKIKIVLPQAPIDEVDAHYKAEMTSWFNLKFLGPELSEISKEL